MSRKISETDFTVTEKKNIALGIFLSVIRNFY